ncbi:MAG: hypothetical protein IT198_03560 [Acidimicrobiia bacterium]|nr:hypothetical protein [Acidimicrobiia bacterium]
MPHPHRGHVRTCFAVLACCVALLACGNGDTSTAGDESGTESTSSTTTGAAATTTTTDPSRADEARPADASFDCNEQTGGNDGSWHLVSVREAAHTGYDRVVFEFRATDSAPTGVPRYVVSLRDPPYTEDPSDEPLDVPGTTAIGVTFLNASGVDLSGSEPVVVYTGAREIVTDRTPLSSVVEAGDFENTMTWLLGLDARHCFDVMTLDDPPRIIVDIEH